MYAKKQLGNDIISCSKKTLYMNWSIYKAFCAPNRQDDFSVCCIIVSYIHSYLFYLTNRCQNLHVYKIEVFFMTLFGE